jgi:hypothetical protein
MENFILSTPVSKGDTYLVQVEAVVSNAVLRSVEAFIDSQTEENPVHTASMSHPLALKVLSHSTSNTAMWSGSLQPLESAPVYLMLRLSYGSSDSASTTTIKSVRFFREPRL